jgi:hypothetical protein
VPGKPRSANKIGRKRRVTGWTLVSLGVLAAGAWVWSGWPSPTLWLGDMGVSVSGGHFLLHCSERIVSFEHAGVADTFGGPEPPVWYASTFGFNRSRGCWFNGVRDTALFYAPLWPIPILLWTPAALLLRSGILARRRAMTGSCAKCGYSLAGLDKGTVCPECGLGLK